VLSVTSKMKDYGILIGKRGGKNWDKRGSKGKEENNFGICFSRVHTREKAVTYSQEMKETNYTFFSGLGKEKNNTLCA